MSNQDYDLEAYRALVTQLKAELEEVKGKAAIDLDALSCLLSFVMDHAPARTFAEYLIADRGLADEHTRESLISFFTGRPGQIGELLKKHAITGSFD
ncbi:hypothetical protein [Pseudomonas luteola]|uniref:hypothetical protein n=1 Tax=Pseudomonas luteola TaxID=47886 RepID=UPI002897D024|nr:hypothetical protein [Pseudomonas luteola]